MFPFLEAQAANVRSLFPNAGVWVSNQGKRVPLVIVHSVVPLPLPYFFFWLFLTLLVSRDRSGEIYQSCLPVGRLQLDMVR